VGDGRLRPGRRDPRRDPPPARRDGLYWTGYVFEDDAVWPRERTTWTAGALLLAVAALGGDEPTVAVFGGERLPQGLRAAQDACAECAPS
jgi:hypothetical protein